MDDEKTLTERQIRVLPYLLASPSIEDACRRAKINKSTVYDWPKDDHFRQELKSQRDQVICQALDSLKGSITKAADTLVKHLESPRESVSLRAAEDIIDFVQKALERDELEQRIEALERLAKLRNNPRFSSPYSQDEVAIHFEGGATVEDVYT